LPPVSQNSVSRDSLAALPKPAAPTVVAPRTSPKPSEKHQQPKQDDDSILSFNFLYYIIQKYKLQDIID
jgi:hypothetical protein